jgi:Ni/Fe-hydrogenase subunit HybB-like protein
MERVDRTKSILWAITGLAAAVAVTRFVFGLGAITNLSDQTPWGLWIGFDVMGGVALASGGFVITAIVYIMKREEFHPIVKPAVLTAFLGYMAVIGSLLVDLGLPWNIWHMMIYWNPHSALFEVGWCVMLYSTVLMLEFSPVPLEEFSRYAKIRAFLMRIRLPLVLVGIMLSTLHQSSLGSLFLIMPFKIYPLWYSHILPILFFISAIALGIGMITLESLITSWLYKRPPETKLLSKLCRAGVWVLAVYFIVRLTDIALSGNAGLIFSGTWESYLFLFEILISVIIPGLLFSISSTRESAGGQWIGATLLVFGFVFHRINVGGVTMLRATGDIYLPSWMEIAISAGIISAAALVFLFAIEKLKVWESRPKDPRNDPEYSHEFGVASDVCLGSPLVAARIRYSLYFVAAFAIAFAVLPGSKVRTEGVTEVSARPARGGNTLYVDGNRDGYGVMFKHKAHIDSLGENESCTKCHHMNMPLDKQSGCYNCHKDMYGTTDAFDHDWHGSPDGGNLGCFECHAKGSEKSASSVKQCGDCHLDLIPAGAVIVVDSYTAPSYADAMHMLCVSCHREQSGKRPELAKLTICTTCHESTRPEYLASEISERHRGPYFNRVVMPGLDEKLGKETD